MKFYVFCFCNPLFIISSPSLFMNIFSISNHIILLQPPPPIYDTETNCPVTQYGIDMESISLSYVTGHCRMFMFYVCFCIGFILERHLECAAVKACAKGLDSNFINQHNSVSIKQSSAKLILKFHHHLNIRENFGILTVQEKTLLKQLYQGFHGK